MGTFLAQREAEMRTGRARVMERMQDIKPEYREQAEKRLADADRIIEEDFERREALFSAEGGAGRKVRDRAAAEIVDQAQTELEAALHLADRDPADRDPAERDTVWSGYRAGDELKGNIVSADQQLAAERLELSDPDQATEVTVELVVAQAIGQPTVIRNEKGELDDEGKMVAPALPYAAHEIPSERYVPKTRKRAEEIARQKVPDAKKVVKPGWHPEDPVGGKPARSLVEVENANVAVEAVNEAPDVALSLKDELDQKDKKPDERLFGKPLDGNLDDLLK